MKLKFLSVELFNFMSFENISVNLAENGFVKVCGNNNNTEDSATSNGSGKSAIWEAINWCLTGETLRGSKDVVRHGCEDGCFVTLKFQVDGNDYEVLRAKNHRTYKTNLFIKKNGEDVSGKGIRDTEKLLAQYLPDLDANLINSTIILGQGLPMRFTNNTPAGRKDLLEVLSKSDFMITDLKYRVAERKNKLNIELGGLTNDIVRCNTELAIYQKTLSGLEEELADLERADLATYKDAITKNEKHIKDLNDQIEKIKEDYEGSPNNTVDELTNQQFSTSEELHKKEQFIRDYFADRMQTLQEGKATLDAEIRAKTAEVKRLKSITDVCPVCGQKLPDVHVVDTSSLEKELERQTEESKVYSINLSELKEAMEKEIQKNKDTFSSLISSITNKLIEAREAKQLIEEHQREIERIKETNNALTASLDTHESNIQRVKNEMKKATEASEISSKSLEQYTAQKEEVEEKLNIQSKFETILKRDFRGILLQSCISYIDSKAKEYCQKIFNTDLIAFVLDGNNISISYAGKEYESLSGGEKQKIDLIIQFAIRDMLCTYLNFNCNLLVLDELTDNLDSIGCKRIIDFISAELTDIDSVFIISHRSDLELPYDRTLMVTKNQEGISSVLF